MSEQTVDFYEFGRFRLKSDERVLLREDELVSLTPKAFDILLTLLENDGRIVRKDDLMKKVWPDTFVEEGNLTQNVSLLRKALGENASGPQFIETVPRRGYRFVAPVSRVNAASLDNNVASEAREQSLNDGRHNSGLSNSIARLSPDFPQTTSDVNRAPLPVSTLSRSPLDSKRGKFFARGLPAIVLPLAAVLATVAGIAYLSGREKAGASTTAIQSI